MSAPFPQVFTFFSFKGGVGRSMALLNVAYTLAGRGRNVLVLDMDLEAPGVSGFLKRAGELDERGGTGWTVLDLLEWADRFDTEFGRESIAEQTAAVAAQAPSVANFASARPEKLQPLKTRVGAPGRLDVIGSGDGQEYFRRLQDFGLSTRSRDDLIRLSRLLGLFVKTRRFDIEVPDDYGPAAPTTAAYDYVLVDSRTGVTEIGGLCVGPLADCLVLFTGLNDQNVHGTREFINSVGPLVFSPTADPVQAETNKPDAPTGKRAILVASPVPAGEVTYKEERFKTVEQELGPIDATISYHPRLALLETIFVRDYPREYIAGEYRQLADILQIVAKDHLSLFNPLWPSKPQGPKARSVAAERILRLAADNPEMGFVALSAVADSFKPEHDEEYIAADRVFRALVGLASPNGGPFLVNWGNLLLEWGQKTFAVDPHLARLRIAKAKEKFRMVIELPDTPVLLRAQATLNHGVVRMLQGDKDGALAAFTAVSDLPDMPPFMRAQALLYRGAVREAKGDMDGALADCAAVSDMKDVPTEQRAEALFNGGVLSTRKGDMDAALKRYAAVIDLPDVSPTWRALALANRGGVRNAKGDIEGALADFSAVIELPGAPPQKRAQAFFNRGIVNERRDNPDGAVADFTAAGNMFEQILSIDPSLVSVRALAALARLHVGDVDGALAAYRIAVSQTSSPDDLDAFATTLQTALEWRPDLAGAAAVLDMVAQRKQELLTTAVTPTATLS